jgi:SAM-dependent methyltransferase
MAFTDHSAVLVDLPLTHRGAVAECPPENTAISRGHESRAARFVTDHLVRQLGIRSVLDHGCGRGADVAHYLRRSLGADGCDPGFPDAWPEPAGGDYDLVTSVFVLNVLPDPWQRIQALRCAACHLRHGGAMLVVTRSPSEVMQRAQRGNWPAHNDGYWSNEDRGTFQRGIGPDEIIALARHAGLHPSSSVPEIPAWPGACGVVLMKPGSP